MPAQLAGPFARAWDRRQARAEEQVAQALSDKAISGDVRAIVWWESSRTEKRANQEIHHTVTPQLTDDQMSARIAEIVELGKARALEAEGRPAIQPPHPTAPFASRTCLRGQA